MSVRKILLDYSEYLRLLEIEKRYQELAKNTEENNQSGSGDRTHEPRKEHEEHETLSSILQKSQEKNAVSMPMLGSLPSITVPASATIPRDEAEKEKNKRSSKATSQKKTNKKRWYFLGIPQSTTK